jgi:hypothetical protein
VTSNQRVAQGAVSQYDFKMLIRIGCIVLIAGTAMVQSEELTVRSGSKTITIQSGESSSRAMTSGDFSSEMPTAHNSQREIWVCSYDPPGNISGEWPY